MNAGDVACSCARLSCRVYHVVHYLLADRVTLLPVSVDLLRTRLAFFALHSIYVLASW